MGAVTLRSTNHKMTLDSTYRLLKVQLLLNELWIDRNWFPPNQDNAKYAKRLVMHCKSQKKNGPDGMRLIR